MNINYDSIISSSWYAFIKVNYLHIMYYQINFNSIIGQHTFSGICYSSSYSYLYFILK